MLFVFVEHSACYKIEYDHKDNWYEKIVKKCKCCSTCWSRLKVEAEGILLYLDEYYIAHRLNVLEEISGGPNEWNYCDG